MPSKLDFDQWRSKIADPNVVDQLEQEHKAVSDYWSKFTKYEQTNEWSPAGWAEESSREYSFTKVDPTEKDTRAAKEINAAEVMEKHRELLEEIKLDYEQLEAERDMFATSEEMVQHALHPQLAELQEETAAGKQTFTDFLMRGNRYARYVKKERLAQAPTKPSKALEVDERINAVYFFLGAGFSFFILRWFSECDTSESEGEEEDDLLEDAEEEDDLLTVTVAE